METQLKYLTLGILIGYITPYVIALIKSYQSAPTKALSKENGA